MSELQQTTVIPPWTLGWRLQRALDWANVSTQEMADELEVSRGTISRWCHDQGTPKRVFLKHWALRCGVPYEWLAEGIGEAYPHMPNRPAGMSGQPEPGYAEVPSPLDEFRKRLPLTPQLFALLAVA